MITSARGREAYHTCIRVWVCLRNMAYVYTRGAGMRMLAYGVGVCPYGRWPDCWRMSYGYVLCLAYPQWVMAVSQRIVCQTYPYAAYPLNIIPV